MVALCSFIGLVMVVATLLDAFEVVLLPRPVRRRLRVNRYFFRWAWAAWSLTAQRLRAGRRREDFISVFGPLSMVSLFGAWALFLIVGFGLLHWALQQLSAEVPLVTIAQAMVVSGDAFFTLGYGDVVPHHLGGRLLVIVEAGIGFGYIALTIAYLPVLYQHFSKRDYQLIDLSARAGTPPTAEALLDWHSAAGGSEPFNQWLREWEIWACDLIESHSAYPMLAFYRSQHEDHSWLAALAVVLETCSLVIAGAKDGGPPQAAATFTAASRLLSVVIGSLEVDVIETRDRHKPNVPHDQALTSALQSLVPDWRPDDEFTISMARLRQAYEPAVAGLSGYLLLPITQPSGTVMRIVPGSARERIVNRVTNIPRFED